MYTIRSNSSPFPFLLKGEHSVFSIKECLQCCFNVAADKVEVIGVDDSYNEKLREDALVYIYIVNKSNGFRIVVELGLLKFSDLEMSVNDLLLCINERTKDDVAVVLEDDVFLLSRKGELYKAIFTVQYLGNEELFFLNEESLMKVNI